MRKKFLLSIALAGIVSVVSACGTPEDGSESGSETSQAPANESAAPEAAPEVADADLEGVPDVVALVNGTEILKADFESVYTAQYEQAAIQSQMSGEAVDQDELKTQTIEGMIGTELLVQEADERGIEASDEATTAALDELVAANQLGSAEEFYAALAEQGMDEATVNDQLATQVQVEQLIQEEAGDSAPSEEELTTAYDEAVAQQEEQNAQSGEETEVPPFEEARPALEEQLQTQKESAAAESLVSSLREEADITINL
ncbi:MULTISPECIES: SurA N-terminal domain-containing protein [unclassified Arthrobacter]|uniref:SurA N-terminal domain-containing protein n=1 Tax=unclassified Arthrobacter TaxID=235627 RepID=UPI0004245F79|nr:MULTISPECIES: SurA N-terminal domain-containing protein [unclassified Arthrobacter]PVE18803.1 peptidylprolyl isomerase [Arthrobacter sp. Bz4]